MAKNIPAAVCLPAKNKKTPALYRGAAAWLYEQTVLYYLEKNGLSPGEKIKLIERMISYLPGR